MKSAMGFKASNLKYTLKEFDIIYKDLPLQEPILTKELLKIWRDSRLNDSEITLYGKWVMIRQFSLYMCHCGFVCYVPQLPKRKRSDFIPRIFTHGEIQLLFSKADSLRVQQYQPPDFDTFRYQII